MDVVQSIDIQQLRWLDPAIWKKEIFQRIKFLMSTLENIKWWKLFHRSTFLSGGSVREEDEPRYGQ